MCCNTARCRRTERNRRFLARAQLALDQQCRSAGGHWKAILADDPAVFGRPIPNGRDRLEHGNSNSHRELRHDGASTVLKSLHSKERLHSHPRAAAVRAAQIFSLIRDRVALAAAALLATSSLAPASIGRPTPVAPGELYRPTANGSIVIKDGKNRRDRALPLPVDVGDAAQRPKDPCRKARA